MEALIDETRGETVGMTDSMSFARQALERLKAGNLRFVEMLSGGEMRHARSRRLELTATQSPIAIVLGCSDSRAPVEFLFDQGLGDLFVIRVAGNIVAPSLVGSVEFAATNFGTRLVVVLGHSDCGAVRATIEEIRKPEETRSPNLRSIVDRIRPSIEDVVLAGSADDPEIVVHRAVRANVHASVEHLRSDSDIVRRMIEADDLLVVGAEYSLETGSVEFFDQ